MGLGVTELLIILAVVLIVFGPSRLPGLGSGIGDALRNFRKSMSKPDAIDITPDSENTEKDGDDDSRG
jgi:sec-independent protein translocase protein TatA